ncbi:hypothetical protein ACN47E_009341 [Coniothyrium glycines]
MAIPSTATSVQGNSFMLTADAPAFVPGRREHNHPVWAGGSWTPYGYVPQAQQYYCQPQYTTSAGGAHVEQGSLSHVQFASYAYGGYEGPTALSDAHAPYDDPSAEHRKEYRKTRLRELKQVYKDNRARSPCPDTYDFYFSNALPYPASGIQTGGDKHTKNKKKKKFHANSNKKKSKRFSGKQDVQNKYTQDNNGLDANHPSPAPKQCTFQPCIRDGHLEADCILNQRYNPNPASTHPPIPHQAYQLPSVRIPYFLDPVSRGGWPDTHSDMPPLDHPAFPHLHPDHPPPHDFPTSRLDYSKKCSYPGCRRRGHTEEECYWKKRDMGVAVEIGPKKVCAYETCGVEGHVVEECWMRMRDEMKRDG